MEKTKEEKKLDKIKEIAIKNGWKTGHHVFNYLTEIQMHKYDVLRREIDMKGALKKQANDILNWYFTEVEKRDHVLACRVGALAIDKFLKT